MYYILFYVICSTTQLLIHLRGSCFHSWDKSLMIIVNNLSNTPSDFCPLIFLRHFLCISLSCSLPLSHLSSIHLSSSSVYLYIYVSIYHLYLIYLYLTFQPIISLYTIYIYIWSILSLYLLPINLSQFFYLYYLTIYHLSILLYMSLSP